MKNPIRALLLVSLVFVAGCETLDKMTYKPKSVITVNTIVKYPRASKIEKKIKTFDGREVYVNATPLIHSSVIKDITIIPRTEEGGRYYDLKLHMNKVGSIQWMQISVGLSGQPAAFLIDGIMYRAFTVNRITTEDDSEVLVEGPFDKSTAETLKETAPKNYYYYNGD